MKKKIFSVYKLNSYIKSLLEEDIILNDIFIEGEISNFKLHSSGHIYFTLKEDNAAISAIMFKGCAVDLKFKPENGMKVLAYGRISVYEKTGQYQLYAELLEPSGKGALFIAFSQLKEKLEKEGIFSLDNKKEIPKFPTAITLITSPTGAVIEDMVKVIRRRNKSVKIYVYPVSVQGESAQSEICKAIKEVNRLKISDTIILARGGGSTEDLWAFNEESVARAIFDSKIPLISAIGHETDFTIADFAADLRASTPSVAGELSVPETEELLDIVQTYSGLLERAMNKKLKENRMKLEYALKSRALQNPLESVYNRQVHIANLTERLKRESEHNLQIKRQKLESKIYALKSLSPLNTLSRGYTITYNVKGEVLRSVNDVREGDSVEMSLKDGAIKALVTERNQNGKKEIDI